METLARDEISRLSPQERLALIGDLRDSLADTELPLPPQLNKPRSNTAWPPQSS